MNEANAVQLMKYLGVDNAELHGDWIRASCPLAFQRHKSGADANPSFGIRFNPSGKSGFNCFGCNIRSQSLGDLLPEITYAVKRVANPPVMNLAEAYKLVEAENEIGYHGADWTGQVEPTTQKFEAWPLWWLESFASIFSVPKAMAYLNTRGIEPWVSKELDLRYDSQRNTVCFPIVSSTQKLAGMRGRFLKPVGDFRHYDYKWNGVSNIALTWLGEDHIDWMKPVVVVEGQFDYAKVYHIYHNVIANLSTGLSERKVKKLETAMQVVGFFDDDEAGAIASHILKRRLKSHYKSITYDPDIVKRYDLKKGDKLDPGRMNTKDIFRHLSGVVPVDNWPA